MPPLKTKTADTPKYQAQPQMLNLPGTLLRLLRPINDKLKCFVYFLPTHMDTRHALAGLARLGNKAANPESTATFIKGHFDKDSGLFRGVDNKGSVHATALALQAFELLGIKVPSDILSGVKTALKKAPATFGEEVSCFGGGC